MVATMSIEAPTPHFRFMIRFSLTAALFADGYVVRYADFRWFDGDEFNRYNGSLGLSAGVSLGGALR